MTTATTTFLFATSPKALNRRANAPTAGATHADEQEAGAAHGEEFSLISDLIDHPPTVFEVVEAILMATIVCALGAAAFAIGIGFFGGPAL